MSSARGGENPLCTPAKIVVRATDFQRVLVGVGRKGDLVSHVRDSLITIRRLCTFFLTAMTDKKTSKDVITRVKTLALSRDGS